jgi:integrase
VKNDRPIEVLTHVELQALIGACGRGATAVRNRALIAVMAGAGLRLAEALSLVPGDIQLDSGEINVRHGKGRRQRQVGVWRDAMPYVRTWSEKRAEYALGPTQPFFATISRNNLGHELKQGYVRMMLPRVARRAGISKRVHPHGLRHYHADTMHRDGERVGAIQKQLGHSSLATTAIYLDHLTNRDAVEAAHRSKGWSRG